MTTVKENKTYPALNRILWTVYMLLPTAAFVYGYVCDKTLPFFIILAASTAVWYILSRYVFGFTDYLLGFFPDDKSKDSGLRIFLIATAATLAVLLLWFYAFFPGSFFQDSIDQYEQAVTGNYNTWHPVLHTFLFFTVPLKLAGGAAWSIVLFQMLLFAPVTGYICMVLYQYKGVRTAVLAWIYIVLNPYTGLVLIYPIKDIPFAMAGGLAMIMTAQIAVTGGGWSSKLYRCILFGVSIAFAGILRHNGIIFSALLIITLILIMDRKAWIRVLVSFLVCFILVKVPVNMMLNVEDTPQSVMQAVGLPMTIIGNCTVQTPELLDEETAAFVYEIAPQTVWDESYELGNIGILKYYSDADMEVVERTGIGPILKMAGSCIVRSPKASVKAILELTDIVYGWDIKDQGYIGPQVIDNQFGLKTAWHEPMATILLTYYKLVRLHGYNFTRQISFGLIIMLTVILTVSDLKSARWWRRIAVCLPVFAYDFGTMLLLTSPDSRYFYITYLVVPAVLLIMTYDRQT